MIVGIDIDGTLCDPQDNFFKLTIDGNKEYYLNATPRDDVIAKINKMAKGNIINIITARGSVYRAVTKKWLEDNGVKYDNLIMGLEYCDSYIGDNYYNVEDL